MAAAAWLSRQHLNRYQLSRQKIELPRNRYDPPLFMGKKPTKEFTVVEHIKLKT
jgi:hypothetical protein